MGNSQVIVLLLLIVVTYAQYEEPIPVGDPRPTHPEGFGHSDSRTYTTAPRPSTGYPASAGNVDPSDPIPITFPPYQDNLAYPNQSPEKYPLIIPGNGTDPNEPVYLAMLPMKLVYQQQSQDLKASPSQPDYITSDLSYPSEQSYPNDPSYPSASSFSNDPSYPSASSFSNDPSYPSENSYPADPSYPSTPSYLDDPSYPIENSHLDDPSYPSTSSYPKHPTDSSTSSYPNNPSYPSTSSYSNNPTHPSTASYSNIPSYPSTPQYAPNPPYPSTTSYPNNPSYPSTPYPNNPANPHSPSSLKDQTYSETPHDPATNSNPTYNDQPPKEYSFHGVKPPGKSYPCAGFTDGKTYGVSDVCFAYYQCVTGESLYRQCNDHYRFDQVSGQCVPDISCLSACPDQWQAHPTDIYKFILGGKEMSCPYGTYFDYKICSCQSKSNIPHYYR